MVPLSHTTLEHYIPFELPVKCTVLSFLNELITKPQSSLVFFRALFSPPTENNDRSLYP